MVGLNLDKTSQTYKYAINILAYMYISGKDFSLSIQDLRYRTKGTHKKLTQIRMTKVYELQYYEGRKHFFAHVHFLTRCTLSHGCSRSHSNANLRLLQGWSIIDTITSLCIRRSHDQSHDKTILSMRHIEKFRRLFD